MTFNTDAATHDTALAAPPRSHGAVTLVVLALPLGLTSGCTRAWEVRTIGSCPVLQGPDRADQTYLALLLALKDRRYGIVQADRPTRSITAEYRLGYRGHFYNVTWDLHVDPNGDIRVGTKRDRHYRKQRKHLEKWFRNLESSVQTYRCMPIAHLEQQVRLWGVVGHYYLNGTADTHGALSAACAP